MHFFLCPCSSRRHHQSRLEQLGRHSQDLTTRVRPRGRASHARQLRPFSIRHALRPRSLHQRRLVASTGVLNEISLSTASRRRAGEFSFVCTGLFLPTLIFSASLFSFPSSSVAAPWTSLFRPPVTSVCTRLHLADHQLSRKAGTSLSDRAASFFPGLITCPLAL